MRRSIVALLSGALLSVACGFPRSPDSIESRCAQGFSMLEAQSCGPNAAAANPAFTRFQLEEYTRQCKDAESVARIQTIKTTCIGAQEAAVRDRKDERRKIRARYVAQVSELLVDPAYAPLADRYKDLQDRAFHGDRLAKSEAQATLGQLAELLRQHGIEPQYGKELDLW